MNLNDPTNLLIAGVYFAVTGILSLFAIFGVYDFIRYGQSRGVAALGSLLFALFYLTILNNSYTALQQLLQ